MYCTPKRCDGCGTTGAYTYADSFLCSSCLQTTLDNEAVSSLHENRTTLKIKLLTPNAKVPEKAHVSDAGWDMFSNESYTLKSGERVLVSTGVSMAIPIGYYGQILDRSGNAFKKGLHIMAGVIDDNYRGEVKVLVFNTSKEKIKIELGDKIAQMVFHAVPTFGVKVVEDLDDTCSWSRGFW